MEKAFFIQNISRVIRQRNYFLTMLLVLMIISCMLVAKILMSSERVIMVPGLTQEVWISNNGVSMSYLEEVSAMFLPMLLDLTSDSITWKKEMLMTHISQSDPIYMEKLCEYFASAKERYEKFKLSTHFAVKNFVTDTKQMTVKAAGQLISRFGERGYQSVRATYILKYEWISGKLMLAEFAMIPQEEDL